MSDTVGSPRSEQKVALSERQAWRWITGDALAINRDFIRLGIDVEPGQIVIPSHVCFRQLATALDREQRLAQATLREIPLGQRQR